jgi:hypothetical protein
MWDGVDGIYLPHDGGDQWQAFVYKVVYLGVK